jgi:hypothetical protein
MLTHILVETNNPADLDRIMQTFNSFVIQDDGVYVKYRGYYIICTPNPDFIEFACTQQGYAKAIRRLEGQV